MVQNANVDLVKWFEDNYKELEKYEKTWILQRTRVIFEKAYEKSEKRIFKYIVKYAFGHVDPPMIIEGLPSEFSAWEPLNPEYARKKGSERKWIKSGSLKAYLLAANAESWYNKPKIAINIAKGIATYESMFRNGRRSFGARDPKTKVLQETKIQFRKNLKPRDGDSTLRPTFKPMEDFLFNEKFNMLVDEMLEKYLEGEGYGGQFNVPTAG